MDDLQFNVLFNSILVISGEWEGDNERLCAMESHLWLKGFLPSMGMKPRTARSACQPPAQPSERQGLPLKWIKYLISSELRN